MEREIYEYDNGERMVKGDPLALWRRLEQVCKRDYQTDARALIKASDDGDVDAAELLNNAIRTSFRLVPYDDTTGTGAMEEHVHRAIEGLVEFFFRQRIPCGVPQTSTGPMADCHP